MDTVVLDGVEYLKASAAAKRFHYTSDYIGQLCRGKKIDARLVGRTWFVNPQSIEAHQEGRYQNLRSEKQESSQAHSRESGSTSKTKPVRVPVPPQIKSKFLADAALALQVNTNSRERLLRVSYEPDEGHLIPHIDKHHTPPPHRLNVDPADAKKLSIRKNNETSVSLIAEKLPDIALSGKLPVQTIEESTTIESDSEIIATKSDNPEIDEKTLENNVISDDKLVKKIIHPTPTEVVPPAAAPIRTVKILTNKKRVNVRTSIKSFENLVTAASVSRDIAREPDRSDKAITSIASFVPTSVKQVQTVRSISPFFTYAPLLATLFAVLVVTLLLSMSTTIIFSDAGYQTQLDVQVANLLKILSMK